MGLFIEEMSEDTRVRHQSQEHPIEGGGRYWNTIFHVRLGAEDQIILLFVQYRRRRTAFQDQDAFVGQIDRGRWVRRGTRVRDDGSFETQGDEIFSRMAHVSEDL